MKIVVIEDNDILRYATVAMLARHGHLVTGLVCAEDVDDIRLNPPPEIFIIDLNLPGEDGVSLTRRLRMAQPLLGIIMVTARSQLNDKLIGYESGADIYLPKPVDYKELLAAVEALGRRIQRCNMLLDSKHSSELLQLNEVGRLLHGPEGTEMLSEKETAILAVLNRAQGHRLETWQIMMTIGEDVETYAKSSLEVRMLRLRQKLYKVGAGKRCLLSIRGYGYQLNVHLIIL